MATKNLVVQFLRVLVSLLPVNISNHVKTVELSCLNSHNFIISEDK